MSALPYTNPDNVYADFSKTWHYSQAVTLPSGIVKCSGMGGCDDKGTFDGIENEEQVRLAFKFIEGNLRAAGLRGWDDVYLVRSYHTELSKTFQLVVEEMKKYTTHSPLWTCVEVGALGVENMRLEIEVEAIKVDA